MIRKINDLPMRMKFTLLYLLGVLLPICVLLLFVLTSVTEEIRQREKLNYEHSFDRVYSVIENQFTSILALSNAIVSDTTISSNLTQKYAHPDRYYENYYATLRPQISRYHNAYAQQVVGVELYTNNNSVLSGGVCMRIDSSVRDEVWFPTSDNYNMSFIPYKRPTIGLVGRLQVCMVRNMMSTAPYTTYLKIDMNLEAFRSAMKREEEYMALYLISPDGYQVYSLELAPLGAEGYHKLLEPESPDLVRGFGESTAMRGWRLVANVNEQPMQQSIRDAILLGIALGLLCSLFAGALSFLFASSVAKRSRNLLWHMDNTTPDRFMPIKADMGRDEIGELTAHFNDMSDRLKQLINDVYVLELKQKSLELERVRGDLKYLQAQIDPHFLFNTLNGILVVCVRNGYTDLTEIIRALSLLMRRMIDTSHNMVTLREELSFVSMVLKIERFRFGDKLRYMLDADEELMDCEVPVMCVQGLVENACKHGVQHINGQGEVSVRVWREGDSISIDVSDNGVGMTPEQLDALQKSVHSSEDIEGSIGLQNIYRRLVLQYGDRAELNLRAAFPQGVIASIRIPHRKESDDVPGNTD